MNAKDLKQPGPKARPIVIERDYDAAKRLLSLHAQRLQPFLEAGRFQSLIREVSDYERRSSNASAFAPVPESKPAVSVDQRWAPQRRWSDADNWNSGKTAYA